MGSLGLIPKLSCKVLMKLTFFLSFTEHFIIILILLKYVEFKIGHKSMKQQQTHTIKQTHIIEDLRLPKEREVGEGRIGVWD